MTSLDDMLEESAKGAPTELQEDPDKDVSAKSEGDLSHTEKMYKGNEGSVVGVKNVSDRRGVHRGINFPIPLGNGNTAMLKPGSAMPMEKPLWAKIRNTRNMHGDLAFEEVDLKECDVDVNALRETDQPFDPTNEVDTDLIETIFLAIKHEAHEEVIELLTTCRSVATLQHVMREIDTSSKLDKEIKNRYSKFLIRRISELRKAAQR